MLFSLDVEQPCGVGIVCFVALVLARDSCSVLWLLLTSSVLQLADCVYIVPNSVAVTMDFLGWPSIMYVVDAFLFDYP